MNLRTLRYALLIYAAFDFFLGYAGFLPLDQLAAAQFTTVSGTVTDPNGLPYANGTISPILVLPGGTSPTLNGLAYTPPSQPVGLSSTGSFVMNLADNTVLQPAGTKWNFQVCSAAGTVQPAGGKGPVCFSLAAPITISGSSQSITANLNAVALALSFSSGITNSAGANVIMKSNGINAVGSSCTDNGTTFSCTEPIAAPAGGVTSLSNDSYQYSTDATSGLFYEGGHTHSIVTGGVRSMEFQNSPFAIIVNAPIVDFATGNSGLTVAAGLLSLTGTGHPNFGFATDKGQHLVSQAAQADSWGVATCAASTVTVTFTRAYTSTPTIVVSDETSAGGARVSAKSNSSFTITCSGATDVVDYFTGGNPN
jgi:hypothetical protein